MISPQPRLLYWYCIKCSHQPTFLFSYIHKWHKEQIGKVFPSKSFLILLCRSQQAENIIPGERRVSTIWEWMYLNRPISIDLVWSYIFSPKKFYRVFFFFFGDGFYKSSAIYQSDNKMWTAEEKKKNRWEKFFLGSFMCAREEFIRWYIHTLY